MSNIKDFLEMTILERIWTHYGGKIPHRLANGEGAELAKHVGAARSGVPGLVSDLRRLGSPRAVMLWRSEYQAGRRA